LPNRINTGTIYSINAVNNAANNNVDWYGKKFYRHHNCHHHHGGSSNNSTGGNFYANPRMRSKLRHQRRFVENKMWFCWVLRSVHGMCCTDVSANVNANVSANITSSNSYGIYVGTDNSCNVGTDTNIKVGTNITSSFTINTNIRVGHDCC